MLLLAPRAPGWAPWKALRRPIRNARLPHIPIRFTRPAAGIEASPRHSGLSRRGMLQGAAAAAGALGVGALGPRFAAAAAPAGTHAPVQLWFLADTDSLINDNVVLSLIQEATAPFTEQHRGIAVKAGFMQGNGVIPSMIAGDGPDVISDWYAAPYWAGNLLLPLDEYISRDNIDTSVWSSGQMSVMQQPFGTYMLPAYFSPMVYLVNLSAFDEAGLEYPSTDWTYQDMVKIARQMTIHTAKQTRYGTSVQFHKSGINGESWVFRAFGGNLMNPQGTVQTLTDPGSIAAGSWIFEDLVWPGLASSRNEFYGTTGADGLIHGQEVMHVIWDGIILNAAAAIRDSFRWAVYPACICPNGRMTQGTEDFYGINAQTRHPNEAWELLKWLSYEKTFQRSLMRIGAVPPARNDLWPEWQSIVEAVAPPTRGKGLHWFGDAALKGYAYPGEYFRYDDAQVRGIDGPWISKLWNRQIDVAGAFAQADKQANAFLQQAAASAHSEAAVAAALARAATTSATVTFPAPPKAGTGIPATALPAADVSVRHGVYTLAGAGQGVQGGGDNCSFYCTAATLSRATFTCRLTAIANVDAPDLANGAKIGLMARGDLSNNAAEAGVCVAMQRGVHFFARALPGSAYEDQHAGGTPGLLPPNAILKSGSTKQTNYLLKPVWLRLVRQDDRWTAYTSLDGSHWQVAGTPVGVDMAGVWVGLFVTAHDGAFGKSGLKIQATFDHLSGFTPTQAYQLGNP
jgi:multiple sugar transport system substrate-binding protein